MMHAREYDDQPKRHIALYVSDLVAIDLFQMRFCIGRSATWILKFSWPRFPGAMKRFRSSPSAPEATLANSAVAFKGGAGVRLGR